MAGGFESPALSNLRNFVFGAGLSRKEATPMKQKRLRILLAEGEPGEAATALQELFPGEQNGLELTLVSGVSTLLASLELVNPEVILLELSLAHPDPLEAVRLVHRAAPAVPLIVLAGESEKSLAERSLRRGALDYLLKGHMDTHALDRVVRVALERNTLAGLADLLRDRLTGLYTRDGFLTLGEPAMDTAGQKNSTLILLCMRIENLSAIRAEFGSSAAESSLREIGALLAGSFRRTDIVARLGESQFAALAIDAVEPSGAVLCQRLERRIAVLNRDIGPWGPLELRMNVGFWRAKETSTFPEFLDMVEAGLRAGFPRAEPASPVGETVSER
jgi:diguanylate cyclase (GGDEF)-like protein